MPPANPDRLRDVPTEPGPGPGPVLRQEAGGDQYLASTTPTLQDAIRTTEVEPKPDPDSIASSAACPKPVAEEKAWAVDERPAFSLCSSPIKESSGANPVIASSGGLRGWLVVAGGFIDFTVAFGLLNSFGTFQARYEEKWSHLSTTTITWIGSIQLCLFFLGGLFVGPAFDKYGSRCLMQLGTAFCLASFVCTSWSTQYWHYLLAQGLLFGVGNALLFYPATGAISGWFNEKRGLALGIAVSGSSLGGVFWPVIIDRLFDVMEEEVVHRIIALISTPLLVLSCFLVRERPEEPGQDGGQGHGQGQGQSLKTSLIAALCERRFLALSVSLMILNAGMLIPFFYIPLYSQEQGIDATMANNLLAITYSGSFFSRIAAGWLADKFGRFNVLFIVGVLMSVVTCAWIWMTSLAALIAFAVLFGVFSGGLVPLGSACVAQTAPDMNHIGLRIGAMMAVTSVGALGAGPVSGTLRDSAGGWVAVHSFAASLSMLGAMMLFAVRCWYKPRLLASF
ncbi:hypothetical protein CDD83_3895 [Cordyceps sp. RAO-2017]|nr:hypothetical protein CDD83_3895 [Cordyceps sp. RAO-2017]